MYKKSKTCKKVLPSFVVGCDLLFSFSRNVGFLSKVVDVDDEEIGLSDGRVEGQTD